MRGGGGERGGGNEGVLVRGGGGGGGGGGTREFWLKYFRFSRKVSGSAKSTREAA